jgi:hypothetical protein
MHTWLGNLLSSSIAAGLKKSKPDIDENFFSNSLSIGKKTSSLFLDDFIKHNRQTSDSFMVWP